MKVIPQSESDGLSKSSTPFPVVGIGASAGGLEAFRLLVGSIPKKSGMAYVLVQHLSSDHESNLSDILQKSSEITVEVILDHVKLEADTIYVIPPGKILTATDGILNLEPLSNKKIKTIDLFFSSLGEVHQSFAVGIILSGALNDGVEGLKVIKSNGGLTFAQDQGAAFDSMPSSAVKSGAVDFILPADEIIPKLIAINNPFSTHKTKPEIEKKEMMQDDQVFKQLLALVRLRKDLDFTNYKQSTIKRRIVRRMALNKIAKAHEYLNFIREHKVEQEALYNDLLISVTSFFRDKKSFKVLCETILPELLNQKEDNESFRIWVAGCATGEEAYSIAMCLHEHLTIASSSRKIQIFATDVSEIAITKARTGVYKTSELEGISNEQLEKYFNKLDGSYQVIKSIREMCIFAQHNLLKDPPFSNVQLISCRNVLIYLEPILQKKVFSIFHYALKDAGYLLLGKSETVGSSTDQFKAYNQQEKIYQPNAPHGRYRITASTKHEQSLKDFDQPTDLKNKVKDNYNMANAILLSKYAPVGVIVNSSHDVVEFLGKTEKWLTLPSTGKASLNLLKMARVGLSFEIRNLLQSAKNKMKPANKENICFENEGQHYVNVEVVPLLDVSEESYLIVFQPSKGLEISDSEINIGKTNPDYKQSKILSTRNEQLEKELIQTREDMRLVTEIQEAANEELQSVNEELLSANEELQSLNEELETSKEELESSIEEISIINKELIDRNGQLSSSRQYTEEIFKTIYDPLIILDKNLKVLRATEGFYQMFRVKEEDTEGHFLYALGNGQWNIPLLKNNLEKILLNGGVFRAQEVTHIFNSIGKRVMNVTANQFENHNHEKLILIGINDITDKKRVEMGLAEVERLLEESKDRLRLAVDSAGIGTWDYNPIIGELIWDTRCKNLFGIVPDAEVNYGLFLSQIHDEDKQMVDAMVNDLFDRKTPNNFDAEFRLINPVNGRERWIKSKGKAYFNTENIAYRFTGTVLDISLEKSLEEQTKELLRKKDEFMNIASHELKTPITSLKAIVQIIGQSLSEKGDIKFNNLAQKANRQINKLLGLIADLLDVTKLQEGELPLSKSSFSIVTLVRECSNQMIQKPSDYQIDIKGFEKIEVYGDINRIEQVLINLLGNAIKYSPDSNVVKVMVSKQDKFTKIEVRDFGIGIDEDKIPHVFERFFRVDSIAKSFSGMGLGLYISAEIVRRHKGEIGIVNELGKGSTFWFTIPDEELQLN